MAVSVNVLNVSTLVATMPTDGFKKIGLDVGVATNAITNLTIKARFNKSGTLYTIAAVTGSFTTPAGFILVASGDLTVLGAGSTGYVVVDVSTFSEIQIWATSSSGTTGSDITLYANLK